MKQYIRFLPIMLILAQAANGQPGKNPAFEEVISLRSPGNANLSPDGKNLLFTVSQADWKANAFDSEIWLSREGKPLSS